MAYGFEVYNANGGQRFSSNDLLGRIILLGIAPRGQVKYFSFPNYNSTKDRLIAVPAGLQENNEFDLGFYIPHSLTYQSAYNRVKATPAAYESSFNTDDSHTTQVLVFRFF